VSTIQKFFGVFSAWQNLVMKRYFSPGLESSFLMIEIKFVPSSPQKAPPQVLKLEG